MKCALIFGLSFVLLCAAAGVSSAAPAIGAEAGQASVFVDWDWETYNLGIGYGITDNITLGAIYDLRYATFAAFADLAYGRLALQAECWFVSSGCLSTAAIKWTFPLETAVIGFGAGYDWGPVYGDYFLSADLNLAVSESFDIYGAVRFFPVGSIYANPCIFKAGMALGF